MPLEIKETMPLTEMSEKLSWKTADGKEGPARVIREHLERGFFDPYNPQILEAWRDTKKLDRAKFMNTVHSLKLADVLRATDTRTDHLVPNSLKEFLASSGTTGIAGAYYLIPVKLWDEMQTEAVERDICADISKTMIGPEGMTGTTMNVDIAVDGQYIVNESTSGAQAPTETIETTQATLDCSNIYTINFRLGNDLIEDAQFDTVALHVQEAGRQIGEEASKLAATILITAPDGDGTLNAGASGNASETKFQGATTDDIADALIANLVDGFVSDTVLMTHNAALHSVLKTCGATSNEADNWRNFCAGGWPTTVGPLNIVYFDNSATMDSGTDQLYTATFAKDYAIMTARKRWMRMEQYSEPVKDLTGAVISFRQDSISLYKDSIHVITET